MFVFFLAILWICMTNRKNSINVNCSLNFSRLFEDYVEIIPTDRIATIDYW